MNELTCDVCDREVEFGCGQRLPEDVVCEDCVRRLAARFVRSARERVRADRPVVQETEVCIVRAG